VCSSDLAGKVKLGCLPDLDWPGPYEEHLFNMRKPGHQEILRNIESKKYASVSRGPPCASGWN
jgi:hypothetical protein